MKLRKEYIILGILIVALSLYVFLRKSDRSLYELPVLPKIKTADITRIEIDTPEERIALFRKSGSWVIGENEYAADQGKVKQIVGTIGNLTLTTLISDSKNYERYELDKDRRIAVNAWSKDELVRSFDVGKRAPSFRHTFVKIAGDPKVYHGRENFRGQFDKKLDELRDKIVLSFEQDQINQIRLEKDNNTASFVRETSPATDSEESKSQAAAEVPPVPVWKNEAGKAVQDKELKALMRDLTRLECQQYIYDRQKADFKDPIYILTLEGAETYMLSIFEKLSEDASEYPAISSHSDYPFLLASHRAERVMLKPDDIKAVDAKEPESQPAAEKAE
jgi:hypothetical protein